MIKLYNSDFLPRIPEIEDKRLEAFYLMLAKDSYTKFKELGYSVTPDFFVQFGVSPKIVVDVGCGSGELLLEFTKVFKTVDFIGIDTNERTISHALIYKALYERNNGLLNNLEFRVGDVYNLEKEFPAKIDFVCLSYSLHHFDNLEKAIDQIYNCMTEEGVFYFVDFNREYIGILPRVLAMYLLRLTQGDESIVDDIFLNKKLTDRGIVEELSYLLTTNSIMASYPPSEIIEQIDKVGFNTYKIDGSDKTYSYIGYAVK